MSLAFSYKDAEQKLAEIDLNKTVRYVVKSKQQNLQKLSRLLGQEEDFARKQLRRKSVSLPLLYALSVHLKVNLFEPFLNLLPEGVRSTGREAALQEEIEALKKQLAEVMKERDMLEKIVMK